jgi:integrase
MSTAMADLENGPPAKPETRSLPIQFWPEADRNAWTAAVQPTTRLKCGGAAGHLKPVTRDDHARKYGNFLGFLDRAGLLWLEGPPAENVTADNVNAYLTEIKGRLGSVSVHGSICQLRRAAQYIAPDRDFAWLAEIGKDLAFVARPRSKFDRLVSTETLLEAGLTLIREAEHSRHMSKFARAKQVRNGLMVALLALCPIRRKNFAALEIGRSFVEINGTWWIVLSASETKEKRADERPVNELLKPAIGRYIDQHRPLLARPDRAPPALWLSSRGTPMTDQQLTAVITRTTLSTVGVAVSPHLFRTSAASTAATYGGDNPYLGSALLHHTDPSVTITHYNRATSFSAGENFRRVVRRYERG